MNAAVNTTWALKKAIENSALENITEAVFNVEIDLPTTSDIVIYDDFDAHLWKMGHILCRVNKQAFQLFKGNDCIAEAQAPGKSRFWWDFPDSKLKKKLEKIIGLRALMPVTSLTVTSTGFHLRNNDEKIVVRGQFMQTSLDDKHQPYMTLRALRGYRRDFSQAKKLLSPLFDKEIPDFSLKTMLEQQHWVPTETDQTQTLHLLPDMATEVAVRTMAVEMIDQATGHIEGVVSDIDTVFLHQYRVSVRKLRSLISLMRDSLPLATVEKVAPKLTIIAGKTSRLRDLDVFLLEKKRYRAMLPDNHEKGLDELYALVEQQRLKEKARLARYFSSKAYHQDIAACKTELSAAPTFLTPLSQKPVATVVKSLLIKRYRKIKTISAQLNDDSVDEDVHDIRKQFKKLRYLIEFFIDVLPKRRTSKLLSHLKKMQVTLGDFNDYCVQIEFLQGFSDDSQIELTKALSGLISVLHQKQIETRNQVEAALARFFKQEMAEGIKLAYGTKVSGESK